VSKRSYRRLAVVAGAALAVGSMAPAMAAHVGGTADGAANVGVETIDVTGVLGDVQHSNLLPVGAVAGVANSAQLLARGTAFLALGDVQHIVGDAMCLANTGVGSALSVNATALANATVNLSGITGGLTSTLDAPLDIVGDASDCLGSLQGHALQTVGHVQGAAMGAATLATSTATQAAVMAQGLPFQAINIVQPLLLNDLLTVTAGANLNAVLGSGLATLF
jgi:hypothetical protein